MVSIRKLLDVGRNKFNEEFKTTILLIKFDSSNYQISEMQDVTSLNQNELHNKVHEEFNRLSDTQGLKVEAFKDKESFLSKDINFVQIRLFLEAYFQSKQENKLYLDKAIALADDCGFTTEFNKMYYYFLSVFSDVEKC